MLFEFTVRGRSGNRDVAVLAATRTSLADVRDALATLADVPPGVSLFSEGSPLAEDAVLGAPGLRTGALLTIERSGPAISPQALSLRVVGGLDAGALVPLHRGRLHIGRESGCDLVLHDDRVSRRHACLDIGTGLTVLRDLGSTNGTFVDGVRVDAEGTVIEPGQLCRLGDSVVAIRCDDQPTGSLLPADDGLTAIRPPRRHVRPDLRPVDFPPPPGATRARPVQWVAALFPAAAAGALAWFVHSTMFLLFALLTPVMMLSTAFGDRLHWQRSRRRDALSYRNRRALAAADVSRRMADEAEALRWAAPDPGTLAAIASGPGSRLWERRPGDDDHLCIVVGRGEVVSRVVVRRGADAEPAGSLTEVPIRVDLRRGPLGVAGPAELVGGLVRWIVAQLAVLHSPADVGIALFLTDAAAPVWEWARWLPHVGHRVAPGIDRWRALADELTAALDRSSTPIGSDPPDRWIVAVVDRAAGSAEVASLGVLLGRGPAAGIAAVCVDIDPGALPAAATVVTVTGETGTEVVVHEHDGQRRATLDCVSQAWADRVARDLAPLRDAAGGSTAVPTQCRLLDLLVASQDRARPHPSGTAGPETEGRPAAGVDVLLVQRWWDASGGGADTVLGCDADGPVRVDLAADGPHAVIAGTTGAGKSELLRSLVAGLALLHPPDELTFLLIDYKGGAAFAGCVGLPHVAGLVTDLDPHLTRRALGSLEAELRRRERAFAAVGAADLDGYRAAPGHEAVPRLCIVVDEFATLADELPDFVRGLVAVAQRGRSLGLHLVLATQRPGSAVSPEIRANAGLRIALRVIDPADSRDVIDAPDAATISRRTPGRAYVRRGAALQCVQGAGVGEPAVNTAQAPVVTTLGRWRQTTTTGDRHRTQDLTRIVELVRDATVVSGRVAAATPWCDPLPTVVTAPAPLPGRRGRHIPFARLDLPAEQSQPLLSVDLGSPSSWLLVGGPRSGRSGALASVVLGAAERLSPAELEIYVIDAAGELAAEVSRLPQVSSCLDPIDLSPTESLLARLTEREPAVPALLVVDDWDRLLAGRHDAGAAVCADLLAAVLRTAGATAVTTMLTGQRNLLGPRFAAAFEHRIALRLTDHLDYAQWGISLHDVPTVIPPGRGVRAVDSAELQIIARGRHEPDSGPVTATADRLARDWSGVSPSASAIVVRALPVTVARRSLPDTTRLRLGVVGDAAQPLAIDPFEGSRRWLVAGPARSGRTTVLLTLLAEALRVGLPVIVAAPDRSALRIRAQQHACVRLISPTDNDDGVGRPPDVASLLLVDDVDSLADTAAENHLSQWLRDDRTPIAGVIAGRSDELAVTYRGLAAEVRRQRCGVLLRPGPVDGELFGVRLPRATDTPPGRGFVIGEPSWGPRRSDGTPMAIQVALP